ncbi:MAG: nucleotidyltransferase domain-containing protein [Candidatus Methanodesulfokora sp.]
MLFKSICIETAGKAKENSDIDILIVSNDFSGSIGKRVELLFKIEK